MVDNKEIGVRIESRRKALGYTLDFVAEQVGVAKSTILRYEQGTIQKIKTPVIASIAKVLRVAPEWICCKTDDMFLNLNAYPHSAVSYNPATRIPILGRIAAGYPLYAEEHIEGYTYIDTPEDGEYFGLVVSGDSMDAARIQDGDLLIVRRQSCVDNGDIAVVLVNGCDATVKRFYRHDNMVTLVPQSSNPRHVPQMYDLDKTELQIQGKVVEVKIRV